MSTTRRPYGEISGLETLGLFGAVFAMPFVQGWRLLWKPFTPSDSARTWRRVKADAGLGYAVGALNAYQIQFVDGSTQKVYEKWAPSVGIETDIEKIEEGAQLLWATPRKAKRVLVYVHGGGYLLPIPLFTMTFWRDVSAILSKGEEDVSVVFLEYGLVPKADFPTPLKQTIACIKHLISSGYSPEDILLVGDSAGASIILQVFAHILHPLPGVAEFSLPSPIGAVVLISPFVALGIDSPTFLSNAKTDIFGVEFFEYLDKLVRPTIPESQLVYVEAAKAPKGWFKGVDELASRVLITVGNAECLKHDIETFAEEFRSVHNQASLIKIPGGTHNEPYGAYLASEPDIGEWPSKIADWLGRRTATSS